MDETKNGDSKIVGRGKTTCAYGDGCQPGCGCACSYGYGGGHRVIWWIVGIVLLAFVFALGVKAGEFRDEVHAAFGGSGYGRPMMQYHHYQGGYGGGGGAVPVTNNTTGIVGSGSTGAAPTGL